MAMLEASGWTRAPSKGGYACIRVAVGARQPLTTAPPVATCGASCRLVCDSLAQPCHPERRTAVSLCRHFRQRLCWARTNVLDVGGTVRWLAIWEELGGAPALCSRRFRIPAFTAFRSVTTVIMEKSNVHCTQLSRLQVLRAVVWRLPVVAMPVMASSDAMSSLWLGCVRDGRDRDWAVAFKTPRVHRVVARAMARVGQWAARWVCEALARRELGNVAPTRS